MTPPAPAPAPATTTTGTGTGTCACAGPLPPGSPPCSPRRQPRSLPARKLPPLGRHARANRVRGYPHELSGGMRQRATIALALACEPEIIVMDEPTTAVDVVMQRQIVRRLMRLRRQFGFAIVFVTHDLSLLVELADRIMVMYAGRIVEIGSASAIYHDPRHPYSQGLRDSFPPLHGPLRELRGIPGSPPDLRALPAGCAFQPRCPKRQPECATSRPELPLLVEHGAACHLKTGVVESEAVRR